MKNLWTKSLDILKNKTSEQNFNTWIKPIQIKEIEGNIIRAEVPNKFIKDWVNENYKKTIEDTFSELGFLNYELILNINNKIKKIEKENNIKEKKKILINNDINNIEISNINAKYTFDTFVSGTSNQFAHAAALAVSNNPATTYNPLFIYGGVGLGKTHLIHAIGNEILNKNKNVKICYYSSEKFTNELINSLRHAKMVEFRNKFRTIDILLIDDIQFIAGKKSTQEEFFHTFNALYESHKQIVVTSDKFPKEIPDLEERLRSRFEWGLIADIQAPDTETKQAILKMKADQNKINIPEDVIFFLSNSITNNVRELEGYLIRIGAFSSLTSTPINLEMAKRVLKDIIVENSREVTIEKIQKTVAEHFQIKVAELKSSRRLKNFVFPRQISMYICRKLTELSYPEIGAKFGGKDHSTIIHAIKKIDKKIEEDIHTKILVEKLMDKMNI
ncbi:MAG: chromosomal replication initiator protein DnaA [Deltaproteobacteria bacterium]|jgi:chromosomal replication initiator protein|nr:chromosomal replication initiator protein DnaA [Deltaproteobacteria bacterium]MCW9049977.1 chromosomal replication initiator protein DnaA [Deltaproteobacteria bacterium]